VTLAGERGVTGDLRFRVDADLGRLQTIANRFSAEPAAAGGIRRGTFSGSLFANIESSGAVKAGLEQGTTDFTYVTVNPDNTQQEYSDRVSINASVAMPADNSAATIAADIAGRNGEAAAQCRAGTEPQSEGADQLRSVDVSQTRCELYGCRLGDAGETHRDHDVPALMKAIEGAPLPENTTVAGVLEVKGDIGKAMRMGQPIQPQGQQPASAIEDSWRCKRRIGLRGRDVLTELQASWWTCR
jgi:hypothetical protein